MLIELNLFQLFKKARSKKKKLRNKHNINIEK